MTGDDLAAVARELDAAWATGRPLAPFSGRVAGFDAAAGYAVQRHRFLQRQGTGVRRVGRKIGFTNRSIWPLYGVFQPIWGAMDDRSVQQLADDRGMGTGTLSLRGLFEPRIEPEIVLHLASAPQPGEGPAQLLQRVDRVAHGFEIVQSPYPGWKFGAADAIAAGSLHGGLMLGPAVAMAALAADPLAALSAFSITLSCDGQLRAQGVGANVLDGPLHALAHLVQVLADGPADDRLQPGEWVSTGTLTDALPIQPGQVWTTALQGVALPGLKLTLAG
ncbi:MAG: 2-hydroxyhexa-2,4-dienoate hydratase [Pseudomonadota bacterium]|jgi:2-oxo-3-hexenedioate decarboxylase